MNCHEFEAVLDERGMHALPDHEADALESHAADCADCAAALASVRALRHDPLPAMARGLDPARLQGRRGSGTRRTARPWRSVGVLGLFGLGGAVFAGVAMLAGDSGGTREGGADPAASATAASEPSGARADSAEAEAARALDDYAEAAERDAYDELAAELMSASGLPDGDMFVLLRIPPIYPPEALEHELEGRAVVEFTVSAEGSVEDAAVVESSDPVFEPSTLETISRFKYKPRIENGRPVAVEGVQLAMSYAFAPPAAGDAPEPSDDPVPDDEPPLDLTQALECLTTDDLRCIELVLDEAVATYDLSARQQARVDRIYGFVHFRRGHYQRAIDAYRHAIEQTELAGRTDSSSLMTIAQIHYRQHQYQQAFDYAVDYLKTKERPRPADYVFVDRLRELGATVR